MQTLINRQSASDIIALLLHHALYSNPSIEEAFFFLILIGKGGNSGLSICSSHHMVCSI